MNVLILTPDRVGSTLLQRMLTIYMLRKGFGKPVVNLHELTNGIEEYYNAEWNCRALRKPNTTDWGYYQKLPEIQSILTNSEHYVTSRLARYHILNRKDSIEDQLPFYEFLNKNFFIISGRRKNIFEHGLSWVINSHSKVLNVYTPFEKEEHFSKLYRDGVSANKEGFTKYLDRYLEYVSWSDLYFNVQSYFNYEDSIDNLEKYILSLDFMTVENNTWRDMFEISFNDWNTVHKIISDTMLPNTDRACSTQFITTPNYTRLAGEDWPKNDQNSGIFLEQGVVSDLDPVIRQEIISSSSLITTQLTDAALAHVRQFGEGYKKSHLKIQTLVEQGYLVTGVPMKLQTIAEKKTMIKNYSECENWFIEWALKNNIDHQAILDDQENMTVVENNRWLPKNNLRIQP